MNRSRITAKIASYVLLFSIFSITISGNLINAADSGSSDENLASGIGIPAGVNTGGTELSYLDAYLSASQSRDCWELTLKAVCAFLYARIDYNWPFGFSLKYGAYASVKMEHYNPDLLIGSYTRLGKSPLDITRLLYSDLQLTVTQPLVDALAGPATNNGSIRSYRDPNQWSGRTGESQQPLTVDGETKHRPKTTLKFNEVDVVGHPGHVLYLWNVLVNGESLEKAMGGDVQSLATGAITGTMDAVSTVPSKVEKGIEDVQNTTNASSTKAEKLSDVEGWEGLQGVLDDFDLIKLALLQVLGDSVSNVIALWQTLQDYFATWRQITSSLETFERLMVLFDYDRIMEASQLILDTDLQELINEGYLEAVEDIEAAVENIRSFTGGAGGFSFNQQINMCYADAKPLYPYFLSGIDMLQWKFNVPEMVYRDSYKTPFASDVEEHYIGLPNSSDEGSALISLGNKLGIDMTDINAGFSAIGNNWGTVYPRNGFVSHSDGVKVGAVTAVRSAHVVTREKQLHVYNYLAHPEDDRSPLGNPDPLIGDLSDSGGGSGNILSELISQLGNNLGNSNKKNFIYKVPKAFSLTDATTGKWQLMGPKSNGKCFPRFGDGDYSKNGRVEEFDVEDGEPIVIDTSATPVAWSDGKQSEDDAYVYTLWRQYSCCRTPQGKGNTVAFVFAYLGDINLDIPLL